MKERFRAYFDLTSAERAGIAFLLCLLLLLGVARIAMVYVAPTPGPGNSQNKLTEVWEAQKRGIIPAPTNTDTLININTADSVTILSLNGIGPKITQRILEHRRKNGSFKNYSQLWEVYHFSAETKKELLEKTVLR